MKYARRMGILCCVVVSALGVSSCTDSAGNLTAFGRAILNGLADYFFYEGFTVDVLNQYPATRLHLVNSYSEAITAEIDLDAVNFLRYDFQGMDVTKVDNGDGTGSILLDLNIMQEVQVPLYINESFATPTWQVDFPVNIYRMGEQATASPIGTDTITVTGHLRPFSALDYPRMTAFDIGGITLENELLNYLYGYSRVPRLPSPDMLPAVLATGEFQIVGGVRVLGTLGGYTRGERALAAFPCGPIDGGAGLVVCPTFPAAASAGPFLQVVMVMDDVIPLADPVNYIQYAVVFDADGNTANNFVADPAFPNDFFQGTDLWYFLSYDPTNGWSLSTVDASGAGNPTAFLSDASAIIRGNMIYWVIPIDEFPGASIANASYRLTSFSNNGPFSTLDQYEVDYEPGLDEPLFPVPLPAP